MYFKLGINEGREKSTIFMSHLPPDKFKERLSIFIVKPEENYWSPFRRFHTDEKIEEDLFVLERMESYRGYYFIRGQISAYEGGTLVKLNVKLAPSTIIGVNIITIFLLTGFIALIATSIIEGWNIRVRVVTFLFGVSMFVYLADILNLKMAVEQTLDFFEKNLKK